MVLNIYLPLKFLVIFCYDDRVSVPPGQAAETPNNVSQNGEAGIGIGIGIGAPVRSCR
jgi:hypothetical protein